MFIFVYLSTNTHDICKNGCSVKKLRIPFRLCKPYNICWYKFHSEKILCKVRISLDVVSVVEHWVNRS